MKAQDERISQLSNVCNKKKAIRRQSIISYAKQTRPSAFISISVSVSATEIAELEMLLRLTMILLSAKMEVREMVV